MKRMIWPLTATVLGACQSPVQSHGDILQRELKTVSYENGISITEATIIADSYLYVYASGLGPAPHAKVTKAGEGWVGEVYRGTGVSPVPAGVSPVHINGKTGEVSWEHGPTVARIDFSMRVQAAAGD